MSCNRCWKCKEGTGCIREVSFAPSAMPTRHIGITQEVDREKQWDRDMPAYQRLRRNGIQPPRIDDCSDLEKHANDQFEVEMGKIVPPSEKPKVIEGLGMVRQMEAEHGDMAPVVERHEA